MEAKERTPESDEALLLLLLSSRSLLFLSISMYTSLLYSRSLRMRVMKKKRSRNEANNENRWPPSPHLLFPWASCDVHWLGLDVCDSRMLRKASFKHLRVCVDDEVKLILQTV